jgi:inhibitor of KinA
MSAYKVLIAGDTALVVEFGDRVDRKLSTFVLALARRLDEIHLDGIVETVPTFRSLMVHYDPLVITAESLVGRIVELMEGLRVSEYGGREWRLPVCYDPEIAPDLNDVAARANLTPDQVVERHSSVTYHVYMLGFMPGFAYLGDLPAELVLPRRETPRSLRIPAGSVAIATTMSCVFPRESPTGWHVVGRSPVALSRRTVSGSGLSVLLAPGDKVTFAPISLREYRVLAAKADAGTLDLVPVNDWTGAAA